MKKLLALLLVFCLASMANAAVSIDYNVGSGDIEVSSDSTATWWGYIAITDTTNGDYSSVTATGNAGSSSSVGGIVDGPYGAIDHITDINADAPVEGFDVAAGIQFTADYTHVSGQTRVDLLDTDNTTVLDYVIIPEPMTMSLLCLGGLGLLRRRR